MSQEKSKKTVVTFGEVMLRLSTPSFERFTQAKNFNVNYAGAEANVAVSMVNLGMNAAHVTRLPENDIGIAAQQTLQKFGVDTRFIQVGSERMGLYFLENGSMQRASRIIYDRFDSAFAMIKKGSVDWEEILKGASWFHYTGITPAISQGAADVCLEALQAARKLNITISGDINYRRNLWQYGKSAQDVMPSLIELTDIIVAGTTDLENCIGIGGDNFEKSCQLTMKKFPNIQKISTTVRDSISSSHNKISALLYDGKKLVTSKQYDLTHIVDRIGAGDAFMAGLIYGLLNKKGDQQSIEFAIAASAWKHSVEGDVNLATVADIEALVRGENTGKLLR